MSGLQIALAAGVILLLLLVWSAQRSKHAFDWKDMLMDPTTNKASLNAGILALMAMMALWVCVQRSSDGKDVDTLVLGVLGIFVTGRLGAQGIAAFKRAPDAGSTVEETVRKTVVTAQAPPPAASDAPLAVNVVGTPDQPLEAAKKTRGAR